VHRKGELLVRSTYLKEPKSYRILEAEDICFYAHYHQQVEVVYCVSGKVPMLIDGVSYTLQAGDVALVFPNCHHYYQPLGESGGNHVYLMLFYPSHTENFYTDLTHRRPEDPVLRRAQLPEFFAQIWEQFYQVYADNQELYMFKAYASLLAAHMIPLLKLQPLCTREVSAGTRHEAIQAVLNYVNQHFTEDITLAAVAKELGFSYTTLSHTFSETVGNSFPKHVNSLRISHAKRLLRSSNYAIDEVGSLSGFQSRRTFFRKFQEMCGQTPSEYRRECRK